MQDPQQMGLESKYCLLWIRSREPVMEPVGGAGTATAGTYTLSLKMIHSSFLNVIPLYVITCLLHLHQRLFQRGTFKVIWTCHCIVNAIDPWWQTTKVFQKKGVPYQFILTPRMSHQCIRTRSYQYLKIWHVEKLYQV